MNQSVPQLDAEITPDGSELILRIPLAAVNHTALEKLGLPVVKLIDPKNLTDRQAEILREVRRGKSNKEIGKMFNVAERTVKFHVADLLRKFGVDSRQKLSIDKRKLHARRRRKRLSDLNGRDAELEFIPSGPGVCLIKRKETNERTGT